MTDPSPHPMERMLMLDSLLKVAAEHKKTCGDPSCMVSMFMLGQLFQLVAERPLTNAEREIFI